MMGRMAEASRSAAGGVIDTMIGAIGGRAPSFVHRAIWWRCLTIPPSLSSPSGE